MTNEVLKKVSKLIEMYVYSQYDSSEAGKIVVLLCQLTGINFVNDFCVDANETYESVQEKLADINELDAQRKQKGIFYTPNDVVNFIVRWTVGIRFDETNVRKFYSHGFKYVDYEQFCFRDTVFDPTCGTGEFLLSFIDLKMEVLRKKGVKITPVLVSKVLGTVYGNDINEDSIQILKLRILLYLIHNYGVEGISKVQKWLTHNFTIRDFVSRNTQYCKFDYVVGNPPYVEDVVSKLSIPEHYGNIYANVLVNAAELLKKNGVFGFIVPLSYVATPRMEKLRKKIEKLIDKQYIMSYADRPDCLFAQVHQKLCIVFGKNSNGKKKNIIYTGSYQYWYKEERGTLFNNIKIMKNDFVTSKYVPKIGVTVEKNIYTKVTKKGVSLLDLMQKGNTCLYLNMRATFWIKAFLNEHRNGEYKKYCCVSVGLASYIFCLLNSSLFWWYWICVSDCWHITGKELKSFCVQNVDNYDVFIELAKKLEEKLEITKVYIGTRQAEYAYKHRDCVDVIHMIDDCIAEVYGLTKRENVYIKEYAYKYRVGGGVDSESN